MMNKRIYFTLPVVVFALVFAVFQSYEEAPVEISKIRKQHLLFLQQAPQKDKGLSRLEKIKRGLPPNAYYEQMAYLTMNPALGFPEPYKVKKLHEELLAKRKQKKALKAPGDTDEDPWVSRGPYDVGGRTRVLLFDPNDQTGKRVFAGAISGGLWVNNDITMETSTWQQVPGLPSNLNISCITVDPRNNDIWYVGTGEQYTAGDVVGTGVYKTLDGGSTWSKVLDVEKFSQTTSQNGQRVVGGTYFINDIEAWDNGNKTEVYIGVSTHIYANADYPLNYLGFFDRGLYRSIDDGSTWEQLLKNDSFNDFEIDADGNLWVATTESPGEVDSRGGKIFKKEKGENTSFVQIATLPNALRTEIEASAINPDKFYILTETPPNPIEEAEIWLTTDAFSNLTKLNEPKDADANIPPTDFTRGQAFYNLMVESDPNNDNVVYVGGIDLFRSTDSGATWDQISKWNDEGQLESLPVSVVHADHHVMQFRPGNTNQAVFGHDGGVSFARDLSSAAFSDVFITLEQDYITSQFYSVAVAPTSFSSGDHFLGGTQDNGTRLIQNGNRESLGILGGDGAHSFYDQVNTAYLIANLVYNNLIITYNYKKNDFALIANNEDKDGFFINPQALDSNLDKLFSNGPKGTLYRYDNIADLETIGKDGFQNTDPVAPRVSLTNSLLNESISALTVSPYETSSSTVLVGLVNGRLLRLENAHGDPSQVTWKNITGSQFLGSISDVEFGSSQEEIYVTFYNYGVKSVWYTKNGLDANPTWENKEGNLPDLPVLAILSNPLNPQEVILGTELGVWSTADFKSGSPTWKQAYNGMSDVKVTDLDLKKGNNEVFAASYGRGIFSGQFETGFTEGEEISEDAVVVSPTVSEGVYFLSSRKVGPADVLVYDLQGQLVHVSRLDLGNNIPEQVDISDTASGIYFLKIIHAGKEHIEKVIRK